MNVVEPTRFTKSNYPKLIRDVIADCAQATTLIPILAACPATLLQRPSRERPLSLSSVCLIFAISYMCFRLISPTFETMLLPGASRTCAFPAAPSLRLFGPGTLPAPRTLFFVFGTPAAAKRSVAVGGVRRSKVKLRSGRTMMRVGMGVPTSYMAVRALNS